MRTSASPIPRDEEHAIARALLAEADKAPGTVHDVPDRRLIPEIRAMVDPDRLIAMIENQVIAAEPNVLAALALARFEEDPRKALETLDAIDRPETASTVALSLFDWLGATAPPAFRRELLERAARRPSISEDPAQAASLLARVADRWLDLGDAARARSSSGRPGCWRRGPASSPSPTPAATWRRPWRGSTCPRL